MNLPFGLLLALYFVAECAFAALAKTVADPLGLLPTSLCAATMTWWAYMLAGGTRRIHAMRIDADAALGALGSVAILCSLTIAYSLRGVSIMTPMVLMKCGGLAVALAVGYAQGSVPSRRSLAVILLVACGVIATMWHKLHVDGTAAALACAAAYLAGYAAKLAAAGRRRGDYGFFLGMTTLTLAIALPLSFLVAAVTGTTPSHSRLAFLAGVASQGCGAFGGLILLRGASRADRSRGLTSHAALFPLHRSVSVLGATAAVVVLALVKYGPWDVWHVDIFASGELVGVACLLLAMWVGTR